MDRDSKKTTIQERALSSFLLAVLALVGVCGAEKHRYAFSDACDRYSLDAVYHEKYKLITNNIFADTKEFAGRVTDLVADSLIMVMADLPDRDSSDEQEKKIHGQFKTIKSTFISRVKKLQKNITSSWDELVSTHYELMYDTGNSSLEYYLNKTIGMIDSYNEARNSLDSLLSTFISFIKATIGDGLNGISYAAEAALKKDEEEKKKNDTENEEKAESKKSKEELLNEKKEEIAKMIVPGFLGKVTIEVIRRKMDLQKVSGKKSEDRDSVLDDLQFDMLMVRNRIRAIIQTDVPRDKGATDLARRSIYTYWADAASEMYKEKLRYKQDGDGDIGRRYYRNLWRNEETLVDTLLSLMEVYP